PRGSAGMLNLDDMHGILPRSPDVPLRDLGRAVGIPRHNRRDELTVLLSGHRPGVEPEHVDPGQQPQSVVKLIERVANEAVAALSRDDLVNAQPEMNLFTQLVDAELLLSLEPRQLPHDLPQLPEAGVFDSARRQAAGLHLQNLSELIELLHERGIEVRGEIAE